MKKISYKNIKNKVIDIFKMIGIIILYILLQVVLSLVFKDYLIPDSYDTLYYIFLGLIYFISIIVISLFFIPEIKKSIKTFKKNYIKSSFKNWLFGFIIMLISNLYLVVFVTNKITDNEAANRTLLAGNPALSIIVICLLGPILEELVFRANIKKAIKNKWIGCIVSGLIFGSMHMVDFSSIKELLFIIPYGALGFFFSKAYYETDNIFTSIISHIFHNSLAVIVILLTGGI